MDWEQRYQNADIPWDKGSASPTILELTKKAPFYFKAESKTLVPGCGLGHDVALLRTLGLDAFGLDISKTALRSAKETYPNLGEVWLAEDLFLLSEKGHSYDLVWEHTCYCAILPEQRERYIESIFDVLKPEGYFAGVFFIDTGQPSDVGPPFSTTRTNIIELFSPHFDLILDYKPNQSYPGRENREHLFIWRRSSTS